jgi:GTP-binding protein HflX
VSLFFERPNFGERAILVHLNLNNESEPEDVGEFKELVRSAGGCSVGLVSGSRPAPHAKFFVGTGKLDEIAQMVSAQHAELVIFNHNLSPSQERNIETSLGCRVLDRTGLILDIFAMRARTHEGKLQVELAQLQHLSTRLVRGWTHLERQKGGIGLRGPGETQLESDRRMVRERIKSIQKRLDKVRKQRDQGRQSRRKSDVPTVSIVGYTNAGKSTLFNRLTEADVFAADQLFATLDPTMRRLDIPEQGPVIFADTVGFISHLPHRLIDAFRATLEEASSASLLLHLIDAAAEDRAVNVDRVNDVLEEIGAAGLPTLLVYNKIDLMENAPAKIERDREGQPVAVWVSALTGEGVDLLLQAVCERLLRKVVHKNLQLQPHQGAFRAALYEHKAVIKESCDETGDLNLEIQLPESDFYRLIKDSGLSPQDLILT